MIKRSLALLLLLAFSTLPASANNPSLSPLPEHGISAVLITKFIEKHHYKENTLNDEQSSIILDQYLKSLDPNHHIFTLKDVRKFDRYKTELDNALLRGNLEPAFQIFGLFNERRVERAEYALARLEQPFNYELDEEHNFDRTDISWAKDIKELDEIWRKRVKNDVLSLMLSGKEEEEFKKTLRKRYELMKTRSSQFKPEDTYEFFINAYLKSLEPHTAYFSPRNSENFKIDMSLSLEGIGAVLQTIDDYTVVKKVIPGGPADMSNLVKAEDKISGVGQGKEGEIEDVVGWRIDDVVALIRGPKDSIVRLQILPKSGGVDGVAKVVTITRDKIKLEDQRVQQSVIDVPNGDKTSRIGVITIPTFYMDFDAAGRGEKDYVSTTRDTRELIKELENEGVEGIVIDLRNNGGGSLSEAVSLTGLFIKSGPVVQVHDSDGELKLNRDDDRSIIYNGPLAVLVNRYSASASEILAGALQDYGRATIIGEPTFGKGTVQHVVDLNRYAPRTSRKLGQLKLTMAQFFRVNGDSTQHRGVIPDILFPSAAEDNEQGESSLDNALPWAHIKAANYTPYSNHREDLSNIVNRHKERITQDSGFQFLQAQAEARKEAMDKTSVTLLKTARETERELQENENLERVNRFRISRDMEPRKKEDLKDDDEFKDSDDEAFIEEVNLIELREAAAILTDVIHKPSQSELMPLGAKQAANL